MPAATATGMNFDDLKLVMWIAGAFVSALVTGVSLSWWFNQQLSNARKALYVKINENHKDIQASVTHNKDDCRDTKERVTLLEQSHNHLGQRIDGVDSKLEILQKDVTATKEELTALAQKTQEGSFQIMGEIRAAEERHRYTILELTTEIRKHVTDERRV